jgi:hypothetical protein
VAAAKPTMKGNASGSGAPWRRPAAFSLVVAKAFLLPTAIGIAIG